MFDFIEHIIYLGILYIIHLPLQPCGIMQFLKRLFRDDGQTFQIPKHRLYLAVTVIAISFLFVVTLLFALGLSFQFKSGDLESLSVATQTKLNELESKLNENVSRINELYILKEKIEKQLPDNKKNSNDGKGGHYEPLPSANLSSLPTLGVAIKYIESSINTINETLPQLKADFIKSSEDLSNILDGVPLIGSYTFSSDYGERIDPFTSQLAMHSGVDFAAPIGTPVVAAATGKVSKLTTIEEGGAYGRSVEITHANGALTKYGHLESITVGLNTDVKKGDVIGEVGNTGRSTGPHLHFEVIVNNQHINPMSVISPFPIKPNAVAVAAYNATVKGKCANLKLITSDENSKIMHDCIASGGRKANALVMAKRGQVNVKSFNSSSFSNHCYTVDSENRLIIGSKSACANDAGKLNTTK